MKTKKSKLPKVSDKEAAELAQACRMAFGDQSVDEFMDEVFAAARAFEEAERKLEEQSRAE